MDFTYLHFLQTIRLASADVFTPLMLKISTLAEGSFTYLMLALVYWCFDKQAGRRMALNVSFGSWLNQWSKKLFDIDRPWVRDPSITPVEAALPGASGSSFPSGHTARATAVWGALGYSLFRKQSSRQEAEEEKKSRAHQKALGSLCFAILFLIMFSRNYLGVHTFVDVAAAFGIGAALLLALDYILQWVERGQSRDLVFLGVSCVLLLLPMLRYGCLTNAGTAYGFLIGWVLERRFVDFEIQEEERGKLLRFVPGAVILFLALNGGVSLLQRLMEEKYAGFFNNAAIAFFIIFFYPLVFTFAESREIPGTVKKKVTRIFALVLAVLLLFGGGMFVSRLMKHYGEMAGDRQGIRTEDGVSGNLQEMQIGDGASGNPQGMQMGDGASGNPQEMQIGDGASGNPQGTQTGTEASEEDSASTNLSGCPIKLIGHRGYPQIAPENTLASFSRALDIGVDMVELDVQQTADGELVVFHDKDLYEITGQRGEVKDFTLEELRQMDVGSFFGPIFAGEKMPTLKEALELIRDHDDRTEIYLELKDIGDATGFAKQVLKETKEAGMQERSIFASFRKEYLESIRQTDGSARLLSNTVLGDADLILQEYDAPYYGLSCKTLRPDTVARLHEAGKQVYVWAPETPTQIRNAVDWGVDGICTDVPGRARVLLHPEYRFLSDYALHTLVVPGLYDEQLQQTDQTYVYQGMTKAGNILVVSAYDKNGGNSVLYLENTEGNLLRRVDLGFVAHTGGISYDEKNDLLWVTGAQGVVNGIPWSQVRDGVYQGQIVTTFDAGLVNHDGNKVASFLTYDEGMLYVGSYTKGTEGELIAFDVSDPGTPVQTMSMTIPHRIQGLTFAGTGEQKMLLLSQSYQTFDAHLLTYRWDPLAAGYAEEDALTNTRMPEGMEQIQMSGDGLYILFESSARPYRPTARVANDQIWLVDTAGLW